MWGSSFQAFFLFLFFFLFVIRTFTLVRGDVNGMYASWFLWEEHKKHIVLKVELIVNYVINNYVTM